MKLPKLLLVTSGLLIITSCYKDKIDPDMLDDIRFSPEMEVPLVRATLTMGDIVAKDTTGIFQVDPDDFITIKYKQDNLFQLQASDFVEIPDQDPQIFPIFVGMPPVTLNIGLGTVGGVELGDVEFLAGRMELILNTGSALSEDVEVKLSINNAQIGTQDLTHNITLTAGNTEVIDSISLPGILFDFTNGGQNTNYVSVGIEMVNPPAALTGTQMEYSIQFKDLELDYATGYFGDRDISIPNGDFDFDLSGIEKLTSGFRIANPNVNLIVASNIGLPIQIAPDLDGINSANQVTPLGATPQLIAGATDTVGFDTSVVSFNSANSNIADFIAALPSKVLYSGKATLNPAGPTMNNFISHNSAISAGIDVEMPMELTIDNSVLEQQLDGIPFADLIEGGGGDGVNVGIEKLTLIFRSNNGFPFDLDLTTAFLDSVTQDSIYGFSLGLLKAANVSSSGEIIDRGRFPAPREIVITGADLEVLKRCKSIRFRGILNTPGTTPQKFYTHYDMQIFIATRVKVNAEF